MTALWGLRNVVRDCVFKRLLNISQRGKSSLDLYEIQINWSFLWNRWLFSCFVFIFCSKIAQKDKKLLEVTRTAKSCSKRQKLPRTIRTGLSVPTLQGFVYMEHQWFCYKIVVVSPGTHLVKNHESQSRTNESQFKKQRVLTWKSNENAWAFM